MADKVLVNLQRRWFSPQGNRYHPDDNPHSFPAEWADDPEQREGESDDDFKARSEKQKYNVLPNTAEIVEGGKTVVTLRKTANGSVVPEPTAVDEDVESVGNTTDEVPAKDRHDDTHQSTSVKDAAKAADELNEKPGGNPSKSGPKSKK